MSQKMPMPEPLPVYTQDPLPESEVPATEPPQYLQRTPAQEAARLKSLKEFAAQKELEWSGGYMETFYVPGGQVVTNGHLVQPESTASTSHHHYPTASQEKAALASQYGDDSFDQGGPSSSHHDSATRPGVGKRISGFLKRMGPSERAQNKALAWTPEEEAANAAKYPMSEGTYMWEDVDKTKKQ